MTTVRFLLIAVAVALLQAPWVSGVVQVLLKAAIAIAALESAVELIDRLFDRDPAPDQEPGGGR